MASNQRRKQSASAVGPEQLIRLEGSSSSKRSNDGKSRKSVARIRMTCAAVCFKVSIS